MDGFFTGNRPIVMAGLVPAMTVRACVEIPTSIDALPFAPVMTMKGRWLPSSALVASPPALRTAAVSQLIRDSGAWSNQ